MEKIQLWSDMKQEVMTLARSVVSAINRASGDIASKCGQRPPTEFYVEAGKAQVYLYGGGILISDHRMSTAMGEHWKGSLEEWSSVKSQLKRLTDPLVVMEELAARL